MDNSKNSVKGTVVVEEPCPEASIASMKEPKLKNN